MESFQHCVGGRYAVLEQEDAGGNDEDGYFRLFTDPFEHSPHRTAEDNDRLEE